MNTMNKKRMSQDEMRAVMLSNAKALLSEENRVSAPELSGELKPIDNKQRLHNAADYE